jgi:hypothetical protein
MAMANGNTDNTGSELRRTLSPAAWYALPLGTVEPIGWLRDQLRLQADGLTGHLDEIWADVGPESAWLGGSGEDWERGPYYCDGLIPLAYLLRDEWLLSKAQRWIERVLTSQQADGQFGPRTNDDWWPRMVMLKALAQYYEATADERVLPFMTRYFRYQLATLPERPLRDWGQARGAENLLVVYWLYERSREDFLLDLADLLIGQTIDWGAYFTAFPCKERQTAFSQLIHVVNVAMALKEPAMRYLRDGHSEHRQRIDTAIANLMHYHGQVQGMFSGDEWLAGTDPTQGVELCAVVEAMFSFEQLMRIYGEGHFADRLETITYNALPATITADMRAHQYDQQPNQVLCTVAPRNWTLNDDTSNTFGLEPNFGCCTANMHQGWPKFAASLWMATPAGGLAAIAYAPCVVRAQVAGGAEVIVEEQTTYPFAETVQLTLHLPAPVPFPLLLRVPGWCQQAHMSVNGQDMSALAASSGFAPIQREWKDGDTVEIRLPMSVRVIERPRGATGVALGPLVFALQIGEEWTRIPGSPGFGDWEVRPTTPWNYGLELDPDNPEATCRVERNRMSAPPFGHDQSAVQIHAVGHALAEWSLAQNSAGQLPASPVTTSSPAEPVTLIPYGCARLRIAEFPRVIPLAR